MVYITSLCCQDFFKFDSSFLISSLFMSSTQPSEGGTEPTLEAEIEPILELGVIF